MRYQPDAIWDAATWAEIDQAVAEEVKRVSVVRRAFRTELVMAADGTAPSWISGAAVQIHGAGATARIYIPEGDAHPFVEVSAGFRLSGAQVENESSLHTGKTLARMAAKQLARSEDDFVLMGTAKLPPASFAGPGGLAARHGVATYRKAKVAREKQVEANVDPPAAPPAGPAPTLAERLLTGATSVVAQLTGKGWPEPYALILGTDLYTRASSPLVQGSTETPASRLAPRAKHILVSDALTTKNGVVVSLAGDPTTLYVAREAATAFVGETIDADGVYYNFRAFERIQYAVRDPQSIGHLIP